MEGLLVLAGLATVGLFNKNNSPTTIKKIPIPIPFFIIFFFKL